MKQESCLGSAARDSYAERAESNPPTLATRNAHIVTLTHNTSVAYTQTSSRQTDGDCNLILFLTQEACHRLGNRTTQDFHTGNPAHVLPGEITFYPTMAGPVRNENLNSTNVRAYWSLAYQRKHPRPEHPTIKSILYLAARPARWSWQGNLGKRAIGGSKAPPATITPPGTLTLRLLRHTTRLSTQHPQGCSCSKKLTGAQLDGNLRLPAAHLILPAAHLI